MSSVKDFSGLKAVSGPYLISENQLRVAKNGSFYLALKLTDPSGDLAAKVWEADEELFKLLAVGNVIELNNIQPKVFKDQIQLEWDAKNRTSFKLIPEEEVDFSRFLPHSPANLTICWEKLQQVIASIQEETLQKVIKFFFDDQTFSTSFMKVPAALKRHHAYLGGLLEHTAGVTALCQAAAEYYPLVNRDLLLTGALLHDIGKTRTYKMGKGFDGTDEGKLIGHLVLGVEMVERAFSQISLSQTGPLTQLQNNLLHLLVSHHGIMEWGSPIEPLTLEACILHHADNMDAQVIKFLTVIRNQEPGIEWAAYDPGLGRSIFMGGLPIEDAGPKLGEGV